MPSINSIGMKIEFRTNGLEDIRKKFLALEKTIALKIIKDGLIAGATVIQGKARQNLISKKSKRTGALINAVIVRSGRANSPNRLNGYEEWAGVTIARGALDVTFDESGDAKFTKAVPTVGKPSYRIRPNAYAHLIEFGVRPHAVGKGSQLEEFVLVDGKDAKGRRRKRRSKTGREGQQSGRMHPGFAERPFMRPAFDEGQFEAHQVMIATIRRRFEEETAPMARTPARRSA